jgi:ATP-binding protein involved in chromosome partitioning
MVSRAIKDFLGRVGWGDLDFLVVDLPPGTGDASITIAQSLPDALMLIVTTPQKVALADVRKAINMFRKMGIDIVGIVENMSYFQCEHSTDRIEIFGQGGGEGLSKDLSIRFLGALPIDIELRKSGDEGWPFMLEPADTETGKIFQRIARDIVTDATISRAR